MRCGLQTVSKSLNRKQLEGQKGTSKDGVKRLQGIYERLSLAIKRGTLRGDELLLILNNQLARSMRKQKLPIESEMTRSEPKTKGKRAKLNDFEVTEAGGGNFLDRKQPTALLDPDDDCETHDFN